MLFTFLLVVQAIIAALLVTVILMQRSEGGGLTSGGSPSGLMSARGAADFLTRSTAVLAALFIGMSILLAFLAASHRVSTVDTSLQRSTTAPAEQPLVPPQAQPQGNEAAPVVEGNAVLPDFGTAGAGNGSDVPLAQ